MISINPLLYLWYFIWLRSNTKVIKYLDHTINNLSNDGNNQSNDLLNDINNKSIVGEVLVSLLGIIVYYFSNIVTSLLSIIISYCVIYYMTYGNCDTYNNIDNKKNDYVINLLFTKLYILQTTCNVKKVLSYSSSSSLTYVNKAFTYSHGHYNNIGNLDTSDPMWNIVHKALLVSHDNQLMKNIMNKHSNILTGKYDYSYNVKKVVDEYVFTVWSEYCFSETCNLEKYIDTRNKLIDLLKKTFYNHKSYIVPFIGPLLCKIRKFWYKNEFLDLDTTIKNMMYNSGNSFVSKFKTNISESIQDNDLVNSVVLDNVFLSFLVYDFISLYMNNLLINIPNFNKNNTRISDCLNGAFLFPFRFRKLDIPIIRINGDIEFNKNDYICVNLVSSELFFSYGHRSCAGYNLMNMFHNNLIDIFNQFNIVRTDKNQIVYSANLDTPYIISEHRISLTYGTDYLRTIIPCYTYKNINKFYRMECILENPNLYNYIIAQMTNTIIYHYKQNYYKTIDGIIVAEARGFLFGSSVAYKLGIPLFCARIPGKISGPIKRVMYRKSYDKVCELQISANVNMQYKNIVIIDDGIASGASTDALHKLVTECGAYVICTVVAVKHLYTKNNYDRSIVYNIFEL
jgi:adenine phosphoribosyltransferase